MLGDGMVDQWQRMLSDGRRLHAERGASA